MLDDQEARNIILEPHECEVLGLVSTANVWPYEELSELTEFIYAQIGKARESVIGAQTDNADEKIDRILSLGLLSIRISEIAARELAVETDAFLRRRPEGDEI